MLLPGVSGIFLRGNIVGDRGVVPGTVKVQGQVIKAVSLDEKTLPDPGGLVYDFSGGYICPGFIDLHVHGAFGSDVMDATLQALETMAAALAGGGTTSFLATTMSASRLQLQKVLENVSQYTLRPQKGARVLGIHLEGPFLNPGFGGAQGKAHLRLPSQEEMGRYIRWGKGLLKVMTIAPELPGAIDVIKYGAERGVIMSLGHSEAGIKEVSEACKAGLKHVTHTFNAMSGLHHRIPGTVGAALSIDELTVDIIADGIHIHPAVIKILLKAKGIEKVCLITDGIRAGGMPEGEYELGGQKVTLKKGTATLADGTISGSTIGMNEAVKILVNHVDISAEEAIRMASQNPARLLGEQKKGALKEGYDADITVLDENFNVVMTIVEGRVVFEADSGVKSRVF